MLRFDERVHLPKNRENTITFLVNGEPIGTVETLAPGAKTVDIPVPSVDYDSVTDALGYIPYDSSNPDGYITSTALANYVTTNTNQTITAVKSFHNAELITDNFITLNGTTAYLRGQSGINYYNLMNLNNSGITIGSVNQPIKIAGSGTRPQYNSNDLALYSDIPSLANYLENTATGSESLTLLGTVATNANALNIGVGSQATTTNSLALGDYASAEQVGAIAIYSSESSAHRARANGYGSIAIGRNALAINANYNIAIGDNAIAQNTNSIQLGTGNNATSNSLQVMSYKLLDTSTGLIPDARISSNIARLTDIPTVTVDQVYDATSANAQSGIAIANAGFLTGITSPDVTNALGYTPLDTDASNLSSTGQNVFDGQWVSSSVEVANGVAWNSTSHNDAKDYSLSSYLPNDGYKYEVLIRANGTTTSTSGKWIRVGISSDIIATQAFACACRTRTASTQTCAGSVIIPVGSGRKVSVGGTTDSSSDGTYGLRAVGYRRIGTNS